MKTEEVKVIEETSVLELN